MREPSWRLSQEDKATRETREAAKKRIHAQVVAQQISRRLDRMFGRPMRQACSGASSSNAPPPVPRSAVRRSAHQWRTAARARMRIQAKKAETRARAMNKTEQEAWKDYNRENRQFVAPKMAAHTRLKNSKTRVSFRHSTRAGKRQLERVQKRARRPRLCGVWADEEEASSSGAVGVRVTSSSRPSETRTQDKARRSQRTRRGGPKWQKGRKEETPPCSEDPERNPDPQKEGESKEEKTSEESTPARPKQKPAQSDHEEAEAGDRGRSSAPWHKEGENVRPRPHTRKSEKPRPQRPKADEKKEKDVTPPWRRADRGGKKPPWKA